MNASSFLPRPVCLLYNDYKILAFISVFWVLLLMRLNQDLSQKDMIANNTWLILDLLDYRELVNDDSFILFVDFYKASTKFIFLSHKNLGFGNLFCIFIRTLYNPNCSLNIFHFFLNFFQKRLSSFLSSTRLQGITIAKIQILSQVSDDTTLF